MSTSWNPAILLHINYYEQGQTLEEACRKARSLEADGIEFRRRPANMRENGSDAEYLDALSGALDKHPLEWVSFGGPGVNLMGNDAGERERELDQAEAFFRAAAKRFPLKIINTFTGPLANPDKTLAYVEYWHHGSTVATEEQWANAIEGFKRMGALAGELGFRFAFETHGVYLHDSVPASMRLVNEIDSPHVGVLWDHANLQLFQNPITVKDAVKEIGDRMYYVHLKNILFPTSRFLAVSSLSSGIINVREQVRLLYQAGYRGPLCIEAPRQGDREQFAREDLAYLREVVRDVVGQA